MSGTPYDTSAVPAARSPLSLSLSLSLSNPHAQIHFRASQPRSIMLLLSRLQPAQRSDQGGTTTRGFVPLAIECLGRKQHKLRMMASRALPVLVDASDADRCLEYLKQVMARERSLNCRHGALLSIAVLLRSSLFNKRSSSSLHDEEFVQRIVRFPAPLYSSVFDVLFALSAANDVLVGLARKVLAEDCDDNDSKGNDSGFKRLACGAMSAAGALCRVGIETNDSQLVAFALRSDIFDTRVAAVKRVKKVIGSLEIVEPGKRAFFEEIANLLKEALREEVWKGARERHEPTVRRLSRSLVILKNNFEIDVLHKSDLEWLEKIQTFSQRDSDNAIELLCMAGCAHSTFRKLAYFSSDPQEASWRARLSVAESLGGKMGKEGGHWMLFAELLQDDDADVRNSALRSLGYNVVPSAAVVLCCEEAASVSDLKFLMVTFQEKVAKVCKGMVGAFGEACSSFKSHLRVDREPCTLEDSRPIFEEENPDMFAEGLLIVQALAKTCLLRCRGDGRGGGDGDGDGHVGGHEVALSSLLGEMIAAAEHDAEVFAGVSSSITYFGKIHSLLIAAVVHRAYTGNPVQLSSEAKKTLARASREAAAHVELRRCAMAILNIDGGGDCDIEVVDEPTSLLFLLN